MRVFDPTTYDIAHALRSTGIDRGAMYDPIRAEPADPAKAYRVTLTIARSGDHELRRNGLTRDLYDRVGRSLRYVGRASMIDDVDIATWRRWMGGAA